MLPTPWGGSITTDGFSFFVCCCSDRLLNYDLVILIFNIFILTSAFICLCLSVRNIIQKVVTNFDEIFGRVGCVTLTSTRLDFGVDLNHAAPTGIFKGFFTVAGMVTILQILLITQKRCRMLINF